MSALTHSPPQTLGPGSKERKSALVDLAHGLHLDVDTSLTKPELGVLDTALPLHLDGRQCVMEMRAAQFSQWAQDEWGGFYFEFVGLPALVNAFGGGPRSFANTRFDYALAHTWDLKAHTTASSVAPLNDCAAVQAALDSGVGLGFLVLTGVAEYDDGQFRQWQREYRAAQGLRPRPRAHPPRHVRRSKRSLSPTNLEAYFLKGKTRLDDSIRDGAITMMRQGSQASGRPRQPKYAMHLGRARSSGLLLATRIVERQGLPRQRQTRTQR